jgi:hypothetical protein
MLLNFVKFLLIVKEITPIQIFFFLKKIDVFKTIDKTIWLPYLDSRYVRSLSIFSWEKIDADKLMLQCLEHSIHLLWQYVSY